MSSQLEILVALDGEVDRALIETIVARDPNVTVLDYLEVGGPTASGLGSGDALVVAVADYTADARDYRGEYILPRLGDYAVLKVSKQPSGDLTSEVSESGLFDETWKLPTVH